MERRKLLPLLGTTVALPFTFKNSLAQSTELELLPDGQFENFDDWQTKAKSAAFSYINLYGTDSRPFMQFLAQWLIQMPTPDRFEWLELPGANERIEFATLITGRPFIVTAIRMESGATLPIHCHPGGGGITYCVEGDLLVQHFELLPGSRDFTQIGEAAVIEAVSHDWLTESDFTMFTPTRSNLHMFSAGHKGAVVIEVSVQWEGGGEFSYFKPETYPDSSLFSFGRHTGIWVGMNISAAYA